MAHHAKDEIRTDLWDEATAPGFLRKPAPQDEFPQNETEPNAAYQLVHDELLLDGNSRQNLATFCQTWVEPEVRKLMDECLDKNLIDKDEYPQMAALESRCVRMLADLWNAPNPGHTPGCSTAGSSEAAMLGGLALKERWRQKHLAAAKPADQPNLVCGPVQTCWHKFARYFDVELREIPCDGDRLLMTPDEVVKRCDTNTIGVVPTLGSTYNLQYEPVHEVALALDDLEEERGTDVPIHVDAASGGFVAPFLHPGVVWDFRNPRVKSINASGHKFGLTPLGCGWAIWREEQDLPRDLVFRVNYLGSTVPTLGFNFSRPGGQIACQYYNFTRLGREGYRKSVQGCADVGTWLSDQVAALGPFEMVYNGRGGIPGCCWKLKERAEFPFNLYDLADRLRVRGWQIPAYPMPADRSDLDVQRVLCRLGVSRNLAELLLKDLKQALLHLETNPSIKSLTRLQAGGYHHG
jgi:glutamate decarboxylase